MPLPIKNYRTNIGAYQNSINHSSLGKNKQQQLLNTLAKYPGDPVKRAKAELMLHMFLLISNVGQNNKRLPALTEDHGFATVQNKEKYRNAPRPVFPIGRPMGLSAALINAASLPSPAPGGEPCRARPRPDGQDIGVDPGTAADLDITACNDAGGAAGIAPALNTPGRRRRSADIPADTANSATKARPATPVTSQTPFMPATAAMPVTGAINATDVTLAAHAMDGIPAPHAGAAIIVGQHAKDNLSGVAHRLHINNRHIAQFLNKHELLALDEYEDSFILINTTVDYLLHIPEGEEKIARELMHSTGAYGAHKQEPLSRDIQLQTVNDWLASAFFNHSVTEFIARDMVSQGRSAATPHRYSIDRAWRAIDDKLNGPQSSGGADAVYNENLSAGARAYMRADVVLSTLPALALAGEALADATADLGGIDWGFMHAGIALADSLGVESKNLTSDEFIQLGRSLEDMLAVGVISPWLLAFFELPARLFYARSLSLAGNARPVETAFHGKNAAQAALEAFFAENEKIKLANDPFHQFNLALNNYRTRPKLGQPAAADALFKKQNQGIANNFMVVDELLIAQALDQLSGPELAFIQRAAVTAISAVFSAFDTLKGLAISRTISRASYTVSLLSSVDLLAARQNGEIRIYALQQNTNGYRLDRVDKIESQYYALMTDPNTCRRDKDYKLKIYSDAPGAQVMKRREDALEPLIAALVGKHKDQLLVYLYEQGFEETDLEKTQRFLWSLLPLHDCISGSMEGSPYAPMSCMLDVLSFVSLAGQAAGLAIRVAQKSMAGGMLVYRRALISVAARQSLKTVLREGGKGLMRYSLAPAAEELGRDTIIHLGITALRAMDPGLELAGYVGLRTVRQITRVARVLEQRLPVWQKILPQLEASLTGQAELPASYRTASLAGLEAEVSIVKLGGDSVNGQAVYVRVAPETGEIYGKKYTLSANNRLIAVPLPMSKRLSNILEFGLSGRGSRGAGRRMALRRAAQARAQQIAAEPYNMVLASHLLRWIENDRGPSPISIESFIAQNGLTGSRWRHYVAPDGQLTASGRELLERSDINSWNRLFELSPELQLEIIRYLDPRSLKNIVRGFPPLGNEPVQSTSLRAFAQERLDRIKNAHYSAWDDWAGGAAAREKRLEAVENMKACFENDEIFLDLRGLSLTELPASLPEGIFNLNVSGNRLTRLPERLPMGLRLLDVSANRLERLPAVLPDSLEKIVASHNMLDTLSDRLPSGLITLEIVNNQLFRLPDTLSAGLKTLDCSGNRLELLPETLPTLLTSLTASLNRLERLPENLPHYLTYLDVADNRLVRLPATLPQRITRLYADNNHLEALPAALPRKLKHLKVEGNRLTQLPENLPPGVTHIYASNNVLFQLPGALPKGLKYLVAHRNVILSLPDRMPAGIHSLGLNNNQMTFLPDNLPASLESLFIKHNHLTRLPLSWPRALKKLDVSHNHIVGRPGSLPASVSFINA